MYPDPDPRAPPSPQDTAQGDQAQRPGRVQLPIPIDLEARRNMIAQAAYFRAERRGFIAGYELEDWLEAEREIARMLDD